MCIFAFWFQEKLMLGFIGKRNDLRFDTGTITRTNTFNLSVVKRRVGETFPKNLMNTFVGKASPAAKLFQFAV